MKIKGIFFPSSNNFSWLLIFDDYSVCIDPTAGEKIFKELKGHKLKYIINTHEHSDHTDGNEFLRKKTGAKVLAYHKLGSVIPGFTKGVRDGEEIELDEGMSLKVIFTPGHTYNDICLELMEHGHVIGLFTGDTLFNAGAGNCHSGDPEMLYDSFHKHLYDYSDDVLIYPGHDYLKTNLEFALHIGPENKDAKELLTQYQEGNKEGIIPSTFEVERKVNVFIRAESKERFLELRELRNNW